MDVLVICHHSCFYSAQLPVPFTVVFVTFLNMLLECCKCVHLDINEPWFYFALIHSAREVSKHSDEEAVCCLHRVDASRFIFETSLLIAHFT